MGGEKNRNKKSFLDASQNPKGNQISHRDLQYITLDLAEVQKESIA